MQQRMTINRVVVAFSLLTVVSCMAYASDAKIAREQVGLQRGVCVVLGDTELALALAAGGDVLVYTQVPAAEEVATLRRNADEGAVLGSGITIGQGPWSQLQLASDLADAAIIRGAALTAVHRDELMRVLRPGGKALLGDELVVKPIPAGTDDWSHPYHGPDNNPQSQDRVARAPYLTHFLAEPWYCPMPLVTVASGGRLFKAFGHIAIKEREWPLLSTLICQNAYNGTLVWQRKLSPSFMIHRSTMIATPDTLYLADDTSCKRLDAATGEVRDEIVVPKEDGPVWKWMALVDGTLVAMVGQDEGTDPTVRGDRKARGWPWGGPLGQGYNSKTYPWGFGHTILAIDTATKKILWRHRENEPLDARGMCLASGRVFYYSHGKFIGCLDARSGKPIWKSTDPAVLQAIGEHKFAQNPREGFSSSAFIKANGQGLYFAGPTRTDLVAVSAENGKLLWTQPQAGNSQLVLRDDGLFALGPVTSARYDYLSGALLTEFGPRVNCTRATGSLDSIFVRGGRDGTIRYDVTSANVKQQHLCPMRPSCQDGVIPAFGHLFWGPWMCDCNLTLVGVVSLAPAGSFDFAGKLDAPGRLETAADLSGQPIDQSANDWPSLRANNTRQAFSPVAVPDKTKLSWTQGSNTKTATTISAAGGLVFTAGHNGSVRALDAASGAVLWTTYTGGPIHYPPTIAGGNVYVGSSDGWVYCLAGNNGEVAWRFRAAPAERYIPVYGSFSSTWPVASGVLVEDGVAYAAAGIANHDGTHVYALDSATGSVKWHNHTSGALHSETSAGVSVNGHLLLAGRQLHLAGGNMVPVASYDLADGRCVTDPSAPQSHTQFKAGSDLFLVGDQVQAGGAPLYSSRGDYRMVNEALLQTPVGDIAIAYGPHDSRVALYPSGSGAPTRKQATWQQSPMNRIAGLAITPEAIVLAGNQDSSQSGEPAKPVLMALSRKDGKMLWSHSLPALPSSWGLLVDRSGRVVVALEDGRVMAFAGER